MIGADQLSLTKLLIAKEKELRDTLKLADVQAKINEKMNILKNEVECQDQYIQQFERQLKEAEQLLVSRRSEINTVYALRYDTPIIFFDLLSIFEPLPF